MTVVYIMPAVAKPLLVLVPDSGHKQDNEAMPTSDPRKTTK
jgi:hypothetical protein